MSREQIMRWAERIGSRSPRPGYCTGSARFGPNCYDCSGFTYMAYLSTGLTIPADSSLVARWGRTNGQVLNRGQARYADLMIHDKYHDPYNSSGPRGHIGLFDHYSGGRIICWESSGSGDGVAPVSRPMDFWDIAVQHPALAGVPQSTPTVPTHHDLEDPDVEYLLEDTRIDKEHGQVAKRIAIGSIRGADQISNTLQVDRYRSYRFPNMPATGGATPLVCDKDGRVVTLPVDPQDMTAALERGRS